MADHSRLTQAREQLEALAQPLGVGVDLPIVRSPDACSLGARALAIVEQLATLPLPNIDPPTNQELTVVHALILSSRDLLEGR